MLSDQLCFNCDKPVSEPKLFCSTLCQEEGKSVRYIRAVTRDGRIKRPDVAEAVKIRRAILLGGGYPQSRRRVAAKVREFVFKRDRHKCQVCGEPATELHHLDQSHSKGVNEATNLQAMCARCHREETMSRFKPASDGQRRRALMYQLRIDSPEPLRLSDDEEEWPKRWRHLQSERRRAFAAAVARP